MEADRMSYYNSYIFKSSLVGVLIVVYSTYVKWRLGKNPKYRALCDINDSMSCTKVLSSKYSKGFGIVALLIGEKSKLNMPNTVLGLIFYLLQIIATYMNANNEYLRQFSFYAALAAVIGSVYLAYILYFKLRDFCLVCVLSYAVNGSLLYFNWKLCNE